MPQKGQQIAIYPSDVIRKKIEQEAKVRAAKKGSDKPLYGPTVLEIVAEYFAGKEVSS
jgi:hypothetical protein